MRRAIDRRSFLAATAALPLAGAARHVGAGEVSGDVGRAMGPKIRLSCNFYTFNQPLQAGTMTLKEKIDLPRVFGILRDAGYRGYAPLEILGPGDPRPRIRRFLDEAREALG